MAEADVALLRFGKTEAPLLVVPPVDAHMQYVALAGLAAGVTGT